MNPPRDKRNIIISDIHAGSDRAIFPPTITLPPLMADDKSRVYRAAPQQKDIYTYLMKSARRIKSECVNQQKVITFNGDLIEGLHHYTIQVSVPMVSDMVTIFIEIAEAFLEEVGFSVKNGDELRFVSGTETHTGFTEAGISQHFSHLGAEYYDELKFVQNGKHVWFAHQWTGAGKGHNEGNGIHNALKSLYYDSLKEGFIMPDVVVGSHFHKSVLGSFTQKWKTYHGLITPSLQRKTRHGQKVSAFQRNDIGIVTFDVTKDGLIDFHEPILMT